MYAAVHSIDMEIGNSLKFMGVVPDAPPKREKRGPFGIRRSECYVSLLAVQPSGTSPQCIIDYRGFAPLQYPFASPVLMVLARVPPNHQQRGQSPRGTEYRGLIFSPVALAKWIMALSGLLQGSNCCAFLPAKLQPSPVDGSAAGIFHRAEVGGWTCAPLLDVSCLWLVRSSHACRPDGKCATFCRRRGSVANRSTLE